MMIWKSLAGKHISGFETLQPRCYTFETSGGLPLSLHLEAAITLSERVRSNTSCIDLADRLMHINVMYHLRLHLVVRLVPLEE